MEFLGYVLDFIRNIDENLIAFKATHGQFLVYALISFIIFCEVGLVVTPFLPGDSMLFAIGALCAAGAMDLGIVLTAFPVAAALGDNSNRFLGTKFGHKAFAKGTGKIFNDRNRRRANRFFSRYGPRAITVCRFMPFIRAYVPFVAGMSGMRFKSFFIWSLLGSVGWVFLYIWAGYFLGSIKLIKSNFEYIIIFIICIPIIPVIIGYIKRKRRQKRRAQKALTLLFIGSIGIQMTGCTCCAYFNHAWNMEEAYGQATELREARLDSVPGDSILNHGEERKLYDRVLEKGSRIVERFPKNERQVPKAVFFMGEAFRHKNEWRQAVEKYDELERYFPDYDSMPKAEYERAYCLYRNQDFALARFSAERIIEKGEQHKYYLPAMELMSILQEREGLPSDAIASLEAVLATDFGTPWTRARARIRLADLYYDQKNYEKAREHYLHKELFILPVNERYKAQSTAAECLLMLGDNELAAANEYKALADSVVFKDRRNLSLVRQGEILLSMNDERGIGILRDLAYDAPRSEIASRAFFAIGDFRQKTHNYPTAILLYDSSYQSRPASSWAQESFRRSAALSRLLTLKDTIATLGKENKPFFPQEFQVAELFLLRLSETDSALAILARMDSTIEDPELKARVVYTRAFIYDEFKQDTSKAHPFYRRIIESFPQTAYAKQAQANMGLQVNIKTREDLARDAFVKAEAVWLKAQKIPVENIEEIEAAYQNAIVLYDSVITEFSGTESALQAMYVKACILAEEIGSLDSAQVLWGKLSREHSRTLWGRAARDKLGGKLTMDYSDIVRLRERVQQLELSVKQQSDKYWLEAEQKKNEPPPPPKVADDEVLLDDYNTLYNFK
ncbi:MAG: VTT domain-containing protein [Fibromonadaceae bacterium]|jgi:membrane protein DedA with SNARE-associated domain/tetratricopeptide (TPR) repeat protein|nr:VTT domain-containing protein [Fibromonadaceae bacterium]